MTPLRKLVKQFLTNLVIKVINLLLRLWFRLNCDRKQPLHIFNVQYAPVLSLKHFNNFLAPENCLIFCQSLPIQFQPVSQIKIVKTCGQNMHQNNNPKSTFLTRKAQSNELLFTVQKECIKLISNSHFGLFSFELCPLIFVNTPSMSPL